MTKKALRILTIDDDSGCRISAAGYLTLVGGQMVEVAENGEEEIKKATLLQPNVILLDIRMPDMDGLEIMEILWADSTTRNIPVIVITGASLSEAELGRLKTKPNFTHLEQKPAELEKLLNNIETLLLPCVPPPDRREPVLRDFPGQA